MMSFSELQMRRVEILLAGCLHISLGTLCIHINAWKPCLETGWLKQLKAWALGRRLL